MPRRVEKPLISHKSSEEAAPDEASDHNQRGNILYAEQRYEEALAAYEQAAQLASNIAHYHYNRGLALHRLNRLPDALAAYEQVIQIVPDYAAAYGARIASNSYIELEPHNYNAISKSSIIRETSIEREKGSFVAVTVLLCYAHQDERMVRQLKNHLSSLERNGLIALWDYGSISPGAEWEQEIEKHLDEAQMILLLISASFLASHYCYKIEMQRAIGRHERKEARVIPIILRSVHWNEPPIDKLQVLPDRAKPISRWTTQDEGFENVVDGIAKVIRQWNAHNLSDPIAERRVSMANLDQLIATVKMHMISLIGDATSNADGRCRAMC